MAMSYVLFSNETWKNWEKTGKIEVVQKFKQILKDDDLDPGYSYPGKISDLNRALYELVWAIVKENIRKDHALPVISEIITWHPDIPSQLVEVILMVDAEVSTIDSLSSRKNQLNSLLRDIELERLCKERLELDTLGDSGIIKNKKIFHTKQIKVRTKLYYKQQKFNLLREESEGYAKLITELNQSPSDCASHYSIIEVIRSLIGCFNLDPNRVLDLILEAFECHPQNYEFYTELLQSFPCEQTTISELLGFKLTSDPVEIKGLYSVIVLLVQADILGLQNIYSWLSPEDSSMIDDYKQTQAEVQEIVRKANVISTKDKEVTKEKGKEKDDDEEEKEDVFNVEKFNSNQKLLLCVALLEVGNFNHFVEISQKFPEYYLVSFLPISKALCQLIHSTIDVLYRRHCGLPVRVGGVPFSPIRNKLAPHQVTSFSEMEANVVPMLSQLGPYISSDPSLMYKILRISKPALQEAWHESGEMKGSYYYQLMTVLDECILPGLSVLKTNPAMAEEIWELLKLYPYQHRYKLYSRWKNDRVNTHMSLLKNRTYLLKRAKYSMMRITKETVKPISRVFGKLSHNNPGPVLEYILKQVMIYDNLITPVVDSLKYLTSLSYDVLGYCVVEILSQNKDRIANDAMAISPWLQSLSAFVGMACKKYIIDTSALLQFVANQLKGEKSVDMIVLREVVQKMGGIETSENLTAEQLDALSGGELLRREAGQYQQERNIKKSSIRLKEALIDNRLTVPLLLLMAQQRSSVVYKQKECNHLKLIGKLYDECQDTMIQYGSYIFQILSIEELSQLVPPIELLLSDYHINADVAFFLARPLFNHLISSKYDEIRKKDKSSKNSTVELRKTQYIEACNSVFNPIVSSIRPHYDIKVWEDMDPSFFLTFWSLSMSDLEVPHHIYNRELKKLTEQITAASKKEEMTSTKRKREVDRLTSLKDKLEEEAKRQKEHVERVYARLQQEKDNWFMLRVARSPKNDTITAFLQLCLFPRCIFTSLDAVYCAKFVKILHNLSTPNFSTIICYDRMFCDITYTVASCTEHEAKRYAAFLLGTLETVMHWHSSKEIYNEECANFPGFVTKFRVSKQEANDYVDYENYRHVVHKWHYKITKALITCLESRDYIQIRNAIYILQGILLKFPMIINLASVIEKKIEKVKIEEKNNRKDLHVLANSYQGLLKARKGVLIPESDFHIVRRSAPKTAKPAEQKKEPVIISNGAVDESCRDGKVNDVSGSETKSKSAAPDGGSKVKEEKRKNEEDDNDDRIKRKLLKKEKDSVEEDDSHDGEDVLDKEESPNSIGSSGTGRVDVSEDRSSKRRKVDHLKAENIQDGDSKKHSNGVVETDVLKAKREIKESEVSAVNDMDKDSADKKKYSSRHRRKN